MHFTDGFYTPFAEIAPKRQQVYAKFVREFDSWVYRRPEDVSQGLTFPNLHFLKLKLPTRRMVVLPLTAAPELTVLEIDASHNLHPISGAAQWKIISRLVRYVTVCYLTYTLGESVLD
jgi:hypothetical protein